MRSSLFTRINNLEAERGQNFVTVRPFDSMYGPAPTSQMTLAAFRAKASRGLAGFYADIAAAPPLLRPDPLPLQRSPIEGMIQQAGLGVWAAVEHLPTDAGQNEVGAALIAQHTERLLKDFGGMDADAIFNAIVEAANAGR